MERKIIHQPYEKKDLKKSEKPYQVLKPEKNGNWQEPGRKYKLKGLFSLVEDTGRIQSFSDTIFGLYIKSRDKDKYYLSKNILDELLKLEAEKKERKETHLKERLEQKV